MNWYSSSLMPTSAMAWATASRTSPSTPKAAWRSREVGVLLVLHGLELGAVLLVDGEHALAHLEELQEAILRDDAVRGPGEGNRVRLLLQGLDLLLVAHEGLGLALEPVGARPHAEDEDGGGSRHHEAARAQAPERDLGSLGHGAEV